MTSAELQALFRADNKAPLHILRGLTLRLPKDKFGPTNKDAWKIMHARRLDALCPRGLPLIQYDRSFKINWQSSGQFMSQPPVPEDCVDPAEHRFTEIEFQGCKVALGPDQVFRGNWWIESNWNLMEAKLCSPTRTDLMLLCYKFWDSKRFDELAPPLVIQENPPVGQLTLPPPTERKAIVDKVAPRDRRNQVDWSA